MIRAKLALRRGAGPPVRRDPSWRALPIPAATRRRVTAPLVWRRGLDEVPMHRILLGGQNGHTAAEYAARSGDLPGHRGGCSEGPHAELLRRATRGELDDEEILTSPYGAMARDLHQAQRALLRGRRRRRHRAGRPGLPGPRRRGRDGVREAGAERAGHSGAARPRPGLGLLPGRRRTPPGGRARAWPATTCVPARVRRIPGDHPAPGPAGPDVVDRRPARALPAGRRPGARALLDHGASLSRTGSTRWTSCSPTSASCAPGSTYLDVASCYGWFVAEMSRLGFDAPASSATRWPRQLGPAVYGIAQPEQIVTGDAVEFLSGDAGPWDVVSCFSLLHHFVLGRGSVDADRAVPAAGPSDRPGAVPRHRPGARGVVPRSRCAGWDADTSREFLERYGTFDRVIDLGPDQDAVPPYEENYGRHLFACVRNG